jgi:hypothetical protein
MRINDILIETRSDEDFASGLGAVARGVGAVPGAIHGTWDALKQGYQQGRAAVGGLSPDQQKAQKAAKLRKQADEIDGGNSSQYYSTPHPGAQGFRAPRVSPQPAQQSTGGQDRPYVAASQAAPASTTPTAAPTAASTQVPPKDDTDTGAAGGAFGNMASTLAGPNTMANAPVSARNTATPPAAASSTAPAPAASAAAPKPNFSGGQTQAPAASKVNFSGIKNAAAALPKAAAAAVPQFKGPKVNGLQVRNMSEGRTYKFRSNFLGIDL